MIFALLLLFSIVFSLVILIRNQWVFNRQNELNRHENGKHVIRQYMDYDAMMWRFWVWGVEKLKLPTEEKP